MTTCRRCGDEGHGLSTVTLPTLGETPLCELCMENLYAWLGFVFEPPEPALPNPPPFSKFWEE